LLPDGDVLILAGRSQIYNEVEDTNVSGTCLSSAEIYDSSVGTFTEIAGSRFNGCSVLTTLLQDENVLVTRFRQAELFDYREMTFSPTGLMARVRGAPTATMMEDGQVLIAGGYPDPITDTAEIYDPATGMFSEAGTMSMARAYHKATLLQDGRVLVTGGSNDKAELFIPSKSARP